VYVVVMAGGGGTRLWPLSTPSRPKPFIPLLGEETLFQRTVRRVLDGSSGLGLGVADIAVVTAAPYAELVRAQAPGVTVLAEPVGRNTAAAIALATVALERDDDEVMVVLPADQTIEREAEFRAARDGVAGVRSPLVTLGITPDRPATEYGYLLPRLERADLVAGVRTFPLQAFQEKPSPDRAAELVAMPGVAWNAGIFLWRRAAIREALAAFAPEVLEPIAAAVAAGPGALESTYPAVRSISIDYAVMEPAAAEGRVAMGAMEVGWSDLGSWGSLLAALGVRGAGVDGRVVQAGESAAVGPGDLVVARRAGALTVEAGVREGILDPDGPSALLTGVRPARQVIDALVHRVAAAEAAEP
jgi:mannose-1-phosphate guanylyltransferase